jgi:drug/metabolite transporter (DMT)-like permease
VTYIIPVFGLLFGVVALGESIEVRTLAGMALIIAGVAAVMYGLWFERVFRTVHRMHALAR